MSKYKCKYDLNRNCLRIPNGLDCGENCYNAYKQGREDMVNEFQSWFERRIIRTIPIEYDEIIRVCNLMKENKLNNC